MPDRYRTRAVDIEAIRWTGDNATELVEWTHGAFQPLDPKDPASDPEATGVLLVSACRGRRGVCTGEWIIKRGDQFQRMDHDWFLERYEPSVTRGADIEIVERARANSDGTDIVLVPDEIRINGTPVLAPAEHPVLVHATEICGLEPVRVTLTLFARVLTVRAEEAGRG